MVLLPEIRLIISAHTSAASKQTATERLGRRKERKRKRPRPKRSTASAGARLQCPRDRVEELLVVIRDIESENAKRRLGQLATHATLQVACIRMRARLFPVKTPRFVSVAPLKSTQRSTGPLVLLVWFRFDDVFAFRVSVKIRGQLLEAFPKYSRPKQKPVKLPNPLSFQSADIR